LIAELQPDPTERRRCLELDQAEAAGQLEQQRLAWEAWADEPIEPFLSVRGSPGAGLVRKLPRAFCNSRAQAEGCPHKGILTWTRRECTWFDERGINPRRGPVVFANRHAGAWMELTGTQQMVLLGSSGEVITQG